MAGLNFQTNTIINDASRFSDKFGVKKYKNTFFDFTIQLKLLQNYEPY